ncbi:hypothetical protein LguiB_003896 [Lonicera macranthoides]
MDHYDQSQPQAYPPPPPAEKQGGNYVAPPPAGYPAKEDAQTQSRGDGFWRGW